MSIAPSGSLRSRASALSSVVLASALAACGGGGGGGNDGGQGTGEPSPGGGTSELAGGWAGSASAGKSAQTFVLSNGTAWTFLQSPDSAPLNMYFGALALANGAATGSNWRGFDYETRTAAAATASGTYVVGSALNLSISDAGAATGTPVVLSAVPSATYNPSRAATMGDIAGAWGGRFTSNETGVASVTAGGSLNTVTSLGCSSAGVVTPRNNENVFDVVLTLGPAPCNAPNATATGVAFVVGSGPSAKLHLGVATTSGAQGATFIGVR